MPKASWTSLMNMADRPRFIYGLLDDSGTIRYIGQSYDPKHRARLIWLIAKNGKGNIKLMLSKVKNLKVYRKNVANVGYPGITV